MRGFFHGFMRQRTFLIFWLFLACIPLLCLGGESATYKRIHKHLTLDDDKFGELPLQFLPRDGYVVWHIAKKSCQCFSNGFFVAWDEVQLDKEDGTVYLAGFDGASNLLWQVKEQSAKGLQANPKLQFFKDGSLFLVWESAAAGTNNFNLWGRRYSVKGESLFRLPCVVSAAAGSQRNASLALLKSGDMAVCWEDHRNGGSDIYYQEIHPDGSPRYMPDGVAVEFGEGNQRNPSFIFSSNFFAAAIVWEDFKEGDAPICRVTMDLEEMCIPEGSLFPFFLMLLLLLDRPYFK